MKVKINEPKVIETSTGKKKILFKDDAGNTIDSWDLKLADVGGQLIEGQLKSHEWQGKTYTTFTPKQIEETPKVEKVDAEVWERKDYMTAKMSSWKSACDLYSGTGEEAKVTQLSKKIFDDIYNGFGTQDAPQAPTSDVTVLDGLDAPPIIL